MEYQNLAPHVGVLVSLLGLFAGACAYLLWRMMIRLEKKVDDIGEKIVAWMLAAVKDCSICKADLEGKFLSIQAFNDWKAEFMETFRQWQVGRTGPGGLWDAINKIRGKVGI
jgi:hypothetical protein